MVAFFLTIISLCSLPIIHGSSICSFYQMHIFWEACQRTLFVYVPILNLHSGTMEKLERIIIPAAVDSTQQEALSVLKKLKVCFLKHGCI